jgi:hypothetical protein
MRKVVGLAASVAAVLLIAACGGGDEGTEPTPPPPGDQVVTTTLTYGYGVWRPDLQRETTTLTYVERVITSGGVTSVESTLSYPLASQSLTQTVESADEFVNDKRFSGLATRGEVKSSGGFWAILSCAGAQQDQGYVAVPSNQTETVIGNLVGKRFQGGDCVQGVSNTITINVLSEVDTTIQDTTGTRTVPTSLLFSDSGYQADMSSLERAIAYKIPGESGAVSYMVVLLSDKAGVKRAAYGLIAP